jgi:YVTN family beta-propeller protein
MKMKTLKLITLLIVLVFLNSCSDDDDLKLPLGDYENGYFITNEGPFQNGSGTITFVGDDGIVSQNVYKAVNGEDLGNIVNSIYIGNENAYIVVNNSNKIVVVNRYTMEKMTTIEGIEILQPRYMVAQGDTGYISNWGDPFNGEDDFIAVIDLITNQVISTIPVEEGPENMYIDNNNLFVTLEGGFSQNNQVVVIDTNSNLIKESITVGDVPNAITEDGNGNVWVLCGGKPSYTGDETKGQLFKINSNNLSVSFVDFDATDHPEHLTSDSDNLYYSLNGKIYQMDSSASELPDESLNGFDGFYYSLHVNNSELFATDAKDYASEGELKVFDLLSGTLLETITTGIIPGDIGFQ